MAYDWKKLFEQQQQPEVSYDELKARIIEILRTVYDPEIPVNIYDLGLVYGIDIDAERNVQIRMTLTAPNCPVAQSFPQAVQETVMCVPGVKEAKVELVWEPPWTREQMTEAAKLQLGLL
ncbi:MAG TPA: SUF system Fe-S cluster assembly protein [Novimethylophilus sp.]|jgi:FeS assembly SUF system protein|uniref:SUF system Fe-S cluster assembly protein n=1 Tax=Novimethylophilus sp. TaxID=2137426 RepID=UPI002F4062BF